MIDPQAKPAAYIKLLAFVAVLGVLSALVTFVFMALVHQGTVLIWEQAAAALGIDLRLFTVLVCTIGGLLVGFGARYAGGCTSGHAISGMSALQLGSLIAVIGFFLGGLTMTYLLFPLIF